MKKKQSVQVQKRKSSYKPAWNEDLTDMSRYQLSKIEQLQRKVSCSSKNLLVVKESVSQIHEQLKQGIMPESYMDVIKHKRKKEDPKEEYRQKAKAIVYPVLSCPGPKKLKPKEMRSKNLRNEDSNKKKLPEAKGSPVRLSNKTASLAFTSANEPKVSALTIPKEETEELIAQDEDYLNCEENIKRLKELKQSLNINEATHNDHFLEKEDDYLDYEDSKKKLEELKERLTERKNSEETELDVCMAGLNAVLNETKDINSDISKIQPIEDIINSNDKFYQQIDIVENDDIDFDRINKLIAKTHQDLNELNSESNTLRENKSFYFLSAENRNIPYETTSQPSIDKSNTSVEENEIIRKYENSYMHRKRGMNKENNVRSTGTIISRKITNKTDISLSGNSLPRQILLEAEYYKTQL